MNKDQLRKITVAPRQEVERMRLAKKPENKPFPVEVFPKPLVSLIEQLEAANGFNPEFQAGAVLAIYAGCAGNRFKVHIKENWNEPCILWVPVVGDPASLKTPALKTYMRPVWKIEKEWRKEHELQMIEFQEAIDAKQQGVNPDKPPKAKELIISSTTMEAVFKAHSANPNGLLLFRDELVGWVKSMNQYRKGDDSEMWLSIYNNEPIKISRATKDTSMIDRTCISVLGGIQPAVMKEMAGKEENGFTYRFSFIYPEETPVGGWVDNEVNPALLDQYGAAVYKLVNNVYEDQLLRFSTEAKVAWVKWYNHNAELIRSTDDAMRRAIYKKLEAMCARIAALVQLIYWSYGLAGMDIIEEFAMNAAQHIVEYFRATSLRAHGRMLTEDPRIEQAADLMREGKSVREIAAAVKVGKSTVSRWKQQFPDMFEDVDGTNAGQRGTLRTA